MSSLGAYLHYSGGMDSGAGCEQCTDADTAIAWERSRGLGFVAVDESHFFGSV